MPMFIDQYAQTTKTYDEAGRVLTQSWFDEAGAPVVMKDGSSAVRMQYDDSKKPVRTDYFDADGNPVCTTAGSASTLRQPTTKTAR